MERLTAYSHSTDQNSGGNVCKTKVFVERYLCAARFSQKRALVRHCRVLPSEWHSGKCGLDIECTALGCSGCGEVVIRSPRIIILITARCSAQITQLYSTQTYLRVGSQMQCTVACLATRLNELYSFKSTWMYSGPLKINSMTTLGKYRPSSSAESVPIVSSIFMIIWL